MRAADRRNSSPAFILIASMLAWFAETPCWSADFDDCQACHEDVHLPAGGHTYLECLDCHVGANREPHTQSRLRVPEPETVCSACHETDAPLVTSVHRELACAECHGAPHDITASDESACGECHRRPARTVARSVHSEATCSDCHQSAHAIVAGEEPASPVSKANQVRTCGACHQTPSTIMDGYLLSEHGKALLLAGLEQAPGCAHCHGSHDVPAVDDEDAPTSHRNGPEMCGSCHVLTLTVWTRISAHGKAWQQGDERAPICSTCHEDHGFISPRDQQPRLGLVENCGDCHAEYYTTYRDSFHGRATDLRMAGAATCVDCHKWHKNLPADDPASSVHPDNLAETCGSCHGETTAAFLSFDPHSDPRNRQDNPQVFFVWVFMIGLLIAVFGFFAVHDLLWLQRSLVGMARGEFPSHAAEGPHVRRFSGTNIKLHIVVVLTFLLLAATGLPLKYHWTEWAQALTGLMGGLEAARVIHRAAAIGTFGYAIFHVAHILLRAARGERGLFWGFNSMVPQSSDVADIVTNIRYFLYLGPRPAGGRWTYWEKFDYMAVFWGIPIIGLSGLVLWYPNLFTQFLPGWVLNAADVIHSEEALLATGFIFVFHFFHTHMRPEAFPMDPVIFTGRMPLQRFKEERPLEYQRLVDTGKLDDVLTDPPTRAEMRNAQMFGFTAVAIGVALAMGIFWSIISGWLL